MWLLKIEKNKSLAQIENLMGTPISEIFIEDENFIEYMQSWTNS